MGWVLHLNKLESPSPKDALWQVWLKMAKWFWRRRFLNFVNVFSLFHNYLPFEKGGALLLNKLESPSPKDALWKVWLKLAQLFWIKKIFKSCQFIFINSQLSPLWEGRGPSFEQTWIPFTQGYFVSSLAEIGPVVLEKKMKMWKVYRQTDGRVIRKAHLSFQLRWDKKDIDDNRAQTIIL